MRIKRFNTFNESKSDIDSICKKYGITNYTIKDGLVNVDGNVNISHKKLTKIPVMFGTVTGNFNCVQNKLTDLIGSPKEVNGDFNCNGNKLTNLTGVTNLIEGKFICGNTPIGSIYQSTDSGLIPMFNAIFIDGIDIEKIKYWFNINNKPLTEDILKKIKYYYPNI